MKKVVLYEPSIGSNNTGDSIIVDAAKDALASYLDDAFIIELPTHTPVTKEYLKLLNGYRSDANIVCGSNLLVEKFVQLRGVHQWDVEMSAIDEMKPLIFLGVGAQIYGMKFSGLTVNIYRRLLSHEYIHSVRDHYTERCLKDIGFDNVLTTGCPTLWSLKPEKCAAIPIDKSSCCVVTLTDYSPNIQRDNGILRAVKKNYEKIYFWPQGNLDYDYFTKLEEHNGITIISPSLKSYNELLDSADIDYVGTRLHGGIRALQRGRRTLIVAIDNRAIEMHRDFNIPVIMNDDIQNLESTINGKIITDIHLPIENIRKYLKQFNIEY